MTAINPTNPSISIKPNEPTPSYPSIEGFATADGSNYSKTIEVEGKKYTINITFDNKASNKEVFLRKLNPNTMESMVRIALNLGLGQIKKASEAKPMRNYTITTMHFRENKGAMEVSKLKTENNQSEKKTSGDYKKYDLVQADSAKNMKYSSKKKELEIMKELFTNGVTNTNLSRIKQHFQPQQPEQPANSQQGSSQSNQSAQAKQPNQSQQPEHPAQAQQKPTQLSQPTRKVLPTLPQQQNQSSQPLQPSQPSQSNQVNQPGVLPSIKKPLDEKECNTFIQNHETLINEYLKTIADRNTRFSNLPLDTQNKFKEETKYINFNLINNSRDPKLAITDKMKFIEQFIQTTTFKTHLAIDFINKNSLSIKKEINDLKKSYDAATEIARNDTKNVKADHLHQIYTAMFNNFSIDESKLNNENFSLTGQNSVIGNPIKFVEVYNKGIMPGIFKDVPTWNNAK